MAAAAAKRALEVLTEEDAAAAAELEQATGAATGSATNPSGQAAAGLARAQLLSTCCTLFMPHACRLPGMMQICRWQQACCGPLHRTLTLAMRECS